MDIAKSDLTQSQREETCHLIKETVKDFAAHYIKPNIREWDEKQHFPKEVFHKLGDLGLMGMLVLERFGASGLSYKAYVTVVIELSKADPQLDFPWLRRIHDLQNPFRHIRQSG